MHPDHNHSDKKLQELENQSLPDLSSMDEHWNQMKQLLQPAPAATSTPMLKRYGWWIAALFLLSGLVVLTYQLSRRADNSREQDDKLVKQPVDRPDDTADTGRVKLAVPPITIDATITVSDFKVEPPITWHTKRSASYEYPDIFLPDSTPTAQATDAKASLADFFLQLEKQPQVFVIHAGRDTVVTGNDGTSLLIPRHTFDSKDEVVITLKEFYSYEDIITNQLSTVSNGRQLITGGMVHIMATVKGKEVNIQPGKSIRWFIPDTTNTMSEMQLFTGSTTGNRQVSFDGPFDSEINLDGDTLATPARFDGMNWIPQEEWFGNRYLSVKVKVLDLKNEPRRVRLTKKGEIAVFRPADKSGISHEELRKELKERYGYYKVRIRKHDFFAAITKRNRAWQYQYANEEVGDSAWVTLDIAKRYKLAATDTSISAQRAFRSKNVSFNKEIISNISLDNLTQRFSVDIRTLGWINCDRFYQDPRPKIPLYVDLADTAKNYYTILVFDRIKSMMTGQLRGNQVVFANVPEGEPAKLISVGIHNGKTVAAMETIQVSRSIVTGLAFTETTPAAFREEVKGFDD